MKNLIESIKTNPDVRKKTLIVVGTTLATVVAGVVLVKINASRQDILVLVPEAVEVVADAASE